MKINKALGLALIFASLLSACKRPTVTSEAFKPLNIATVDAEHLTLRSRVRFDSPDFGISASTNLRMQRDSVIWVSISSMGFEAARALITQDTLMVMNKINREVLTYNYAGLSRQLNFPVTFNLIQAALLGNPARPMSPTDGVVQAEGHYRVSQDWGPVVVDNYIDEGNMKLDRVFALEEASKHTLTITYGDFTPVATFLFPYNGLISLQYTANGEPAKTEIDISHFRVDISDTPLDFPFSVPASYDVH